jgi:hypothetical protein
MQVIEETVPVCVRMVQVQSTVGAMAQHKEKKSRLAHQLA